MDTLLLPLHLSFAGIWLGCVVTEALFERALLGKGRAQELILVELHKRVDLIVEIPAFVVVLVTGVLLVQSGGGTMLQAKIGLGLLAVAANVYCVWLVFRRADAAHREQWDEFARLDHRQHISGAMVLLGLLAALGLGFYLSTAA